jgi:hypothetical protein
MIQMYIKTIRWYTIFKNKRTCNKQIYRFVEEKTFT